MAVRTDVAVEDRLATDYDSHTYYFCRRACLDQFLAIPTQFITSHHHDAIEAEPASAIETDAGMRLWYESCSCCLSDAHPEIKAALDAEREGKVQPPADAGICEVAEGKPAGL